ncbi:hypothetical protein EES47_25375 [Streptomyces sp. ADI98-12]|nr:hypothetical protein EES47_25375 [Streptomyces sp. ADI98-12]GFH67308.1 hypothetical protein Srut_38220 [Streptomyces rutgersensis]
MFGSKGGLVAALVTDRLRPHQEEIEQAVPAELALLEAVGAFARHYRRSCDAPAATSALSLQITLLDMALHGPELRSRLAATVQTQERHLIAWFTGRSHNGQIVAPHQAQRLVTALRALFVGLAQGVTLGLAPEADERFFADTACALASSAALLDQDADASGCSRPAGTGLWSGLAGPLAASRAERASPAAEVGTASRCSDPRSAAEDHHDRHRTRAEGLPAHRPASFRPSRP